MVKTQVFQEYLASVIKKYSFPDDHDEDLNTSDILHRQGSNASMLDSSRSSNLNRTSSEVSVKLEKDLFSKLRKALKYEFEPLSEEFVKLDPKKLRKLHKQYVLEAFKNLSLPELTPADQGLLFRDIIDEKEMVSYLEIIYKLFPDLNNIDGQGIESLEDFVEEVKQEMKRRGVRSARIFLEMKEDPQKSSNPVISILKEIKP